MADKTKPCTSCDRKVPFNWIGYVPMGHPQLSDHGYFMCGACLKKMRKNCPACKTATVISGEKCAEVEVDPNGNRITFLCPNL